MSTYRPEELASFEDDRVICATTQASRNVGVLAEPFVRDTVGTNRQKESGYCMSKVFQLFIRIVRHLRDIWTARDSKYFISSALRRNICQGRGGPRPEVAMGRLRLEEPRAVPKRGQIGSR